MPILQKCLIVNRGEIAVRIIRACREMGIRSVAVHSRSDANARHVHLADEAYPIGSPSPELSYLNIERLTAIAVDAACDCVHPGYGFLSESADFAQEVSDSGLVWIGPTAETISLMGVKTEAFSLMEKAGVPLIPGFRPEGDEEIEDFLAAAESIGYPIMVKAANGGGGKGIRTVYQPDDLPEALEAARNEAAHAFGDAHIFLEKVIEGARHVEVQVLADIYGNTVHLFERECSAQRRYQKIIEESPSPLPDDEMRRKMGRAAIDAARAVGYVNAGTVEFMALPNGEFYFLEMNTRLQVEHPVTEMVTGLDIVNLQFAIAQGKTLPFTQEDINRHGHAIECRIYAEDPYNNFMPATGKVLDFRPPEGPGIRVDSGIQSGDEIGIHYDPMLAKLIVHESTREAAIVRMQTALRDTVILGLTTNIDFLLVLLEHPAFMAGEVDTSFVDNNLETLLSEPTGKTLIPALVAAALSDMHGDGFVAGNVGTRHALSTQGDGDVYSPWLRADGFRIGA